MANTVRIDPRQATVFIRRSGPIASGELLQGMDKLASKQNFGHLSKIFVDTTEIDLQNVGYSELIQFAEYCGIILQDFRIAILAPTDLAFGVSRMFQTISDIENVLITRKACKAMAWLDVHQPDGRKT
jgi:hypothetical protein